MKLKALLLVAMAAAGVGASIAVADNGKGNDQGQGHGCRDHLVSGTVGPQTFTITTKAGSTMVVTIGGTGQTVRAMVGGCTSTTAGSTLTVRSVDLRAFQTETTTTGTGDNEGEHHHHHGETTTTATTTTTK